MIRFEVEDDEGETTLLLEVHLPMVPRVSDDVTIGGQTYDVIGVEWVFGAGGLTQVVVTLYEPEEED